MSCDTSIVTEIVAAEEEAISALTRAGLEPVDVNCQTKEAPDGDLVCKVSIPKLKQLFDGELPDIALDALVAGEILACAAHARYGLDPCKKEHEGDPNYFEWLQSLEWRNTDPRLLTVLSMKIEESLRSLRGPDKSEIMSGISELDQQQRNQQIVYSRIHEQQAQRRQGVKQSVLAKMEKIESEAIALLANIDLTAGDVRDLNVSIGAYGVSLCGSLPDKLTAGMGSENEIRNSEDNIQKGHVAAYLLASCRYVRYGCNPAPTTSAEGLKEMAATARHDPWEMFKMATYIDSLCRSLNEPVLRAKIIAEAKAQQNETLKPGRKKGGASIPWHVKPLQSIINKLTPGLGWTPIRKSICRLYSENESKEILEIQWNMQNEKPLKIIPRGSRNTEKNLTWLTVSRGKTYSKK